MGVNSRSKLSIDRRLTCAPLLLDPFLSRSQNSTSFIYVKKAYHNESVKLWPNISLVLSTKNGPDHFSNEDSGLSTVLENGPRDLIVLPSGVVQQDLEMTELSELMERDDGESFLVVYRAGRTLFRDRIRDPFFAAHRKASFPFTVHPVEYFYPDREATALGCVDQFRYCLPQSSLPNHCTEWNTCSKAFLSMYDYLAAQFLGGSNKGITAEFEHRAGQFAWSYKEMLVLYQSVCPAFEVHRYLIERKLYFNMVPLIRWSASMIDYRFEVDREPWVAEVETWFMKSFLGGILIIRHLGPTTWLSKPATIWSAFLRPQLLSRRWPWYSSGSSLSKNSDDAEMDDLEESSATPDQGNSGDTEEYEDIDNPI